jgi:hypothetical protein
VHFDLALTTEHSIPRWQDLTEEERSALCYSKSEFAEIRKDIDSTLKLLTAGLTDPERVHFDLAVTTEHSIPRWQDLTKEERSALWYSRSEFAEIREEIDSTLKLLAAGLTDPERVGFCFRGIEYKTPELRKQRASNVINSLKVVFAAQKYLQQRKTESWSPSDKCDTLIARKYRSCTEKCEVEAHRRGLWDAKSVDLLWHQDQFPKLPRRKYAKAG